MGGGTEKKMLSWKEKKNESMLLMERDTEVSEDRDTDIPKGNKANTYKSRARLTDKE